MQNEKGFDLVGKKLFIALPAYDFKLSLKLAISLAHFARISMQHGIDIEIGSICGCSVVSRARNLLMQDFLESSCDYLLFIDSDINFKPESVLRLMAFASNPDKGIVAAVPRVRSTDLKYIANLEHDNENKQVTMDGMGLVKAEDVATAFMMVRRNVFETLVDKHPEWKYYDERSKRTLSAVFDFNVQDNSYVGEDFLFCKRARAEGFQVWIDPTITLGHMGVQEYEGNFGEDVFYPMVDPKESEVD